MADTRPLQNPHFRRLWIANIVTVIGAQLTVVAVPSQIYADTGSSAYVGLTGVFGLVPLVVFGLWGGALADVIDRRTLLICTTIGLIGTSTLFWLQAWRGGTERLAAALPVRGPAGVLRGQPADPQRRTPPAAAPEPAAGRQLAEHDRDAGRRDRRTAHRRRADPGLRLPVALPDRHPHAGPHTGGGAAAAAAADRGHDRQPRAQGGARRARLPQGPPGAADVLPGRHHRDGLRDAAGTVPGDRARRLRRSRGRRSRVRAAVRRHPRGSGARRHLLGMGLPRRAPGRGRARRGHGLGTRDDRLRSSPWAWPTGGSGRCWSWRC